MRSRIQRWQRVLVLLFAMVVLSGVFAKPAMAFNPCGEFENSAELQEARQKGFESAEEDKSIFGSIVGWLFNQLDSTFFALGARPICNLVYNKPVSVFFLNPKLNSMTPDELAEYYRNNPDSRLNLWTFTDREWTTIKWLYGVFWSLTFGVLLVGAVMFAGLKISVESYDPYRKAMGMYTLQQLGLTVLLLLASPALIWAAFEVTSAFVAWLGELTIQVSGKHDFWQLISGNDFNFLGALLMRLFGTLVMLALNLTYIIRLFSLMVTIIVSPVAILCNAFEVTRPITKKWLQEFISNLMIQPVHAILLTIFFIVYGHGRNPMYVIGFLLVLQPMTNMLVAIFTGGHASSFTGMGAAAAMAGLGGAYSLATSITSGAKEVLGLAKGGGLGGATGGAGQMVGAAAAMGGGDEGVSMAAVGAGGPGGIGSAGRPNAAANAVGLPQASPLQNIQRVGRGFRAAGKLVGGTMGAIAGAGMGMAGGNPILGGMMGAQLGSMAGGSSLGVIGQSAAHGAASLKEHAKDVQEHGWGYALQNYGEAEKRITTCDLPENCSDQERHEAHLQNLWALRLGGIGGSVGEAAGHKLGTMFGRIGGNMDTRNLARVGQNLESGGLLNAGDTVSVKRINATHSTLTLNGQNLASVPNLRLPEGDYVYKGTGKFQLPPKNEDPKGR